MTADHGPWTLTLGLHVATVGAAAVVQTRVLAIFLGREDLRLTVRQRTLFDRLAGRLGFGGIPVGQRDFARRYVVRGRPASNVRSILSGGLAAVLGERGPFRLEVSRAPRRSRKEMGPNASQLQVTAPGVDTDVGRMTEMFAVVREALDVLQRVGVASRAD